MAMVNVIPAVYNDFAPIVIGADVIYTIDLPYSLTGYTYEAAIVKTSQGTNVIDFTVDVDEVNDRVTLSLTDTQTAGLTEGIRDYYILQTDGEGLKTKIFEGRIKVERL